MDERDFTEAIRDAQSSGKAEISGILYQEWQPIFRYPNLTTKTRHVVIGNLDGSVNGNPHDLWIHRAGSMAVIGRAYLGSDGTPANLEGWAGRIESLGLFNDDRTVEELESHPALVAGTDSFMSGWGKADGRSSIAAWSCSHEHRTAVYAWVQARSDMRNVRLTSTASLRGSTTRAGSHVHIYVVNPGHPALAVK